MRLRYVSALLAQLKASLLHLLGLAEETDACHMRDALSRRADAVYHCLQGQAWELLLQQRGRLGLGGGDEQVSWERGGGEGGGGCSRAGAAEDVLLPADPFEVEGGGGRQKERSLSLPEMVLQAVQEIKEAGRGRGAGGGGEAQVQGKGALEGGAGSSTLQQGGALGVLVSALGGFRLLLQPGGGGGGAGGTPLALQVQTLQEALQSLDLGL